ncbi:5-formyltetrahydrofolate cyclo-ligase [Candidatus Pelagibacter sp.]|nr:5-formyltetrahydrofolate cyclo-ligase [Candidatus Pelagibacter sp.]
MNKSKIRKNIIEVRKKKFVKNYNINFKYILKVLQKKNIKGKILGGYYPYNYEVNTIEILKKFEKQNYIITLPKIKKNFQMDFFGWSSQDPLKINKYGIPEPISNKIKYPDILLVPIVAYDKDLNRIGYGGGFYDRYLEKIKKVKKVTTIGLAYSFQKVKKIMTNKYDIKLDFIITEKN